MKLLLLVALLCVIITQPTWSQQPFLHPSESDQIASYDNIYTNGTADLRYTCNTPAVYMLIPNTGQGYFYDFLKRFENISTSPIAHLNSILKHRYGGHEIAFAYFDGMGTMACKAILHKFPDPNTPGQNMPANENYINYQVTRNLGWKDRSLYSIYYTRWEEDVLDWPQNCKNRIILVLTDRESADVQGGGSVTDTCASRDPHPSEVGQVLEDTRTFMMVFATPPVLDKWREYSKDFKGRSYIGEFDTNNPDAAMREVEWQIRRHSCNLPV